MFTVYKFINYILKFAYKVLILSYMNYVLFNNFCSIISGGQSRRVSLGVCLLHNPKLIILDEPTVGIDPLLRQE